MQDLTVLIFRDHSSPVRRFRVARQLVRRAVLIGGGALLVIGAVVFDYVRIRGDSAELESLRIEAAQQREQIQGFSQKMAKLEHRFVRLQEFERQVRVIADLPGATLASKVGEDHAGLGGGGEDLDGESQASSANPPDGSSPAESSAAEPELIGPPPAPQSADLIGPPPADRSAGVSKPSETGASTASHAPARSDRSSGWYNKLGREADSLLAQVVDREQSFRDLVEQLRGKTERLASTPSVWPTKGWITSTFGRRTSPFTGKPQLHQGLDIAAEPGTEIAAPARGRVAFSGRKGPLGKTVVLDHGFGIKTTYGHCKHLHVKKGELVERGQWIASVGNTGRSTGPHLHYVVQVNGKAVDPRRYIFD